MDELTPVNVHFAGQLSDPSERAKWNGLAAKVIQLKQAQRTWRPFDQVRENYVAWARPLIEGYYRLKERLEHEGFLLECDQDSYPTFAPIQLNGFLPSGETFYFRCRHETCGLRIALPDGDPVRHPVWEQHLSRWDREEAGMLDAEEAEAVLRELLARYTTAVAPDPGNGPPPAEVDR